VKNHFPFKAFTTSAGVLFASLLVALIIFIVTWWLDPGGAGRFGPLLIAALVVVLALPLIRTLSLRLVGFLNPGRPEVSFPFGASNRKLEREKAVFLEEMSLVLAHEIRNPLGSIKGAAQCLAADALPSQRELLKVIADETDRLNRVVTLFLDYAKPYQIEPAIQDLNALVNRFVLLLENHFNRELVRIDKELDASLPPVKIDGEGILQVLLNLGINAVEAMPEGGVITLRTRTVSRKGRGKAVVVSVADTGRGMDKDEIEKIFTPFYTTKKGGVGLGLAIAAQIMKKHGGRIQVEAKPGQGTVFHLFFPETGLP
jgi:signal transduction histidine kinase